MIRSELLQTLAADNPDLRPEEIEQVVSIFFDEIGKRLAEGGRVELRGFGAFSTRGRGSRRARSRRSSRRSARRSSSRAKRVVRCTSCT